MKYNKNIVSLILLALILIMGMNDNLLSIIQIKNVSIGQIVIIILTIFTINNLTIRYKKKLSQTIIEGAHTFIIVLTIALIITNNILTVTRVSGDSMYPNLSNNDILIVRYKSIFTRFDITVIESDDKLIVKRIIALPGEKIELKGNKIFINDEIISKSYIVDGNNNKDMTVYLKYNEYFVLGDNLSNSYDSRYFGVVEKENIKGIVLFK